MGDGEEEEEAVVHLRRRRYSARAGWLGGNKYRKLFWAGGGKGLVGWGSTRTNGEGLWEDRGGISDIQNRGREVARQAEASCYLRREAGGGMYNTERRRPFSASEVEIFSKDVTHRVQTSAKNFTKYRGKEIAIKERLSIFVLALCLAYSSSISTLDSQELTM